MRQVPPVLGNQRRRLRQPLTLDDLRAFEETVRKHYPALRIAFKNESASQRLLGFLLYPFNPYYMTRYTSTFAPVVYFPTKEAYEGNPRSSITVLAHEFVHLLDTEARPFWFRFSYLFPQCLVPLAFLGYGVWAGSHAWPVLVLLGGMVLSILVARLSMAAFFLAFLLSVVGAATLAVWFSGWASVAFFLGLALLAPWPAPGRVHWERRGYAMNLIIFQALYGFVPQVLRDAVSRSFVGSEYYFMSWSNTSTATWIEGVISGEKPDDVPYRVVADFLASREQR